VGGGPTTIIGIVVIDMGHHIARTDIVMPVYDGGIPAYMRFLVDTDKAKFFFFNLGVFINC